MGKLRRRYRRFVAKLKAGILITLLTLGFLFQISQTDYRRYILLVPIAVFGFFATRFLWRRSNKAKTHLNANGYVVMSRTNELEHRHLAEQILGRDLASNEVVHHINGRKIDNSSANLCVMDREKHEHFHAWLSWRKNKTGFYPRLEDQRRVLETEYGGILLVKAKNSSYQKSS